MRDKKRIGILLLAVTMSVSGLAACSGGSQAKELKSPAAFSEAALEAKEAVDLKVEEAAEAEAKAKAEAEAKEKAEAEARAKAEAEAAAAEAAAAQQTYDNSPGNSGGCIEDAQNLLW